MQAAYYGDLEMVKELVARGARINRQDKGGMSALTNAVWSERVEVVRFLMAHGANPRLKDPKEETILQIAQSRRRGSAGKRTIVALLGGKAIRRSLQPGARVPDQAAARR